MAENPKPPYAELTPDCVLDALSSIGLSGDGRLLSLNSYENRVYQVWLDDGAPTAGLRRKAKKQFAPPPDDCIELADARPVIKSFYLTTQDAATKLEKISKVRIGTTNHSLTNFKLCLVQNRISHPRYSPSVKLSITLACLVHIDNFRKPISKNQISLLLSQLLNSQLLPINSPCSPKTLLSQRKRSRPDISSSESSSMPRQPVEQSMQHFKG